MFPMKPDEHAKIALEAWKKVVQTQEHFNEICMKVRTLYATVLAAILSLYGVFMKDASGGLSVGSASIDPIIFICLAIIVATTLFYFVDREWYHRLLLGAVEQGVAIENRWGSVLPEIQMGQKIYEKSPVDLSHRPWLVKFLRLFVHDSRLKSASKLHSDAKIEVFYKPIRWIALGFLVLSLFFGGLKISDRSVAGIAWEFGSDMIASRASERPAA